MWQTIDTKAGNGQGLRKRNWMEIYFKGKYFPSFEVDPLEITVFRSKSAVLAKQHISIGGIWSFYPSCFC